MQQKFLLTGVYILYLALFPLSVFSAMPESQPSQTEKAQKASPIDDPNLKIFIETAYAAGLRDLFVGTGPFTIFVPSNAAFEKFGKHKLDKLKKPENRDALVNLIIFHIVPGKYMSETLKPMELTTIGGKKVQITVDGGNIKVNQANVTRPDLVGPNGVIHEIDQVLEP